MILLISSICQSQEISNKLLHDLDIDLELGKKYDEQEITINYPLQKTKYKNEHVLNLKNNETFKYASLIFDSNNILLDINLHFKNKEYDKEQFEKLISILPDSITKKRIGFYHLEDDYEEIVVNIDDNNKYSDYYIRFNVKYTKISEDYDAFEKIRTFSTKSDDSSESLLSDGIENSYMTFFFKLNYEASIENYSSKPIYKIIIKTNDKIDNIYNQMQFLLDNDEVLNLDVKYSNINNYDAKPTHIFTVILTENIINKLINSKEISSRFKGNYIAKNWFSKKDINPLQKLVDYIKIYNKTNQFNK